MTLIISRSVAGSSGVDFARQLRERDASLNPANSRKFRSSAAPKGTKLASGYQDRTQTRTSAEEDGKAARIKSLEDMVKLGQMEQATFEALRDEIVGGEVKDAHLVKGLDWKLLERVRKGEDVLGEADKAETDPKESKVAESYDEAGIDKAFDQLEEKEIISVAKEEKAKKGIMEPPSLAGKKMTRDDILRELKASRSKVEEEKRAQQPSLGPKFRRLGVKQEQSRIERDERGREILITMDEEGRVKRRVKKASKAEGEGASVNSLLMPDKDVKPLGMEVPENLKAPPPPAESDSIDIFEDVGNDYNPLGDVEDDEDDSDQDSTTSRTIIERPLLAIGSATSTSTSAETDNNLQNPPSSMPPPPVPNKSPEAARNYFGDPQPAQSDEPIIGSNPLADPAILAALKKASAMNPTFLSSDSSNEEEAAKQARRKKMLDSHDRDAEDMDMGFGSSRFEDQEEGEGRKVKLSVWGKDIGEDDEKEDGKGKRKRGPKKRKGDANSAADVLKVMKRRKEETTL